MKRIKRMLLALIILIGVYFIFSFFVLDGRFAYQTTHCSKNEIDSKNRGLFLCNLDSCVEWSSDSVRELYSSMKIYEEKHFSVQYVGIIFHYQTEMKEYHKVVIDFETTLQTPNFCWRFSDRPKADRSGFPFGYIILKNEEQTKLLISECMSKDEICSLTLPGTCCAND